MVTDRVEWQGGQIGLFGARGLFRRPPKSGGLWGHTPVQERDPDKAILVTLEKRRWGHYLPDVKDLEFRFRAGIWLQYEMKGPARGELVAL